MIALAFLILFLLSWTFIITGSARASISTPEMTVVKELLIAGVALGLLFITLAVGKMFLQDMMRPKPPTVQYYLKQDIRNKN
jgi:Na+-transporting NADH:ubiquinone oxidoreductase subunit NqrB